MWGPIFTLLLTQTSVTEVDESGETKTKSWETLKSSVELRATSESVIFLCGFIANIKIEMDEIVNFLTAVHSSLQAQQQVRQPGLPGSRQVGVQVAALLPQVHLTGFSQRVTDSVVLRDQLLTGGQSITALWRGRRGGRGVSETQTSSLWSQDTTELVDLCPPSPPRGVSLWVVPFLTWPLQTCDWTDTCRLSLHLPESVERRKKRDNYLHLRVYVFGPIVCVIVSYQNKPVNIFLWNLVES